MLKKWLVMGSRPVVDDISGGGPTVALRSTLLGTGSRKYWQVVEQWTWCRLECTSSLIVILQCTQIWIPINAIEYNSKIFKWCLVNTVYTIFNNIDANEGAIWAFLFMIHHCTQLSGSQSRRRKVFTLGSIQCNSRMKLKIPTKTLQRQKMQ